jgi:hypothetical protein
MCEDLTFQITKIRQEAKTWRTTSLGVKPSTQPQQAPWWHKIPPKLTWMNLPLSATEDQLSKDLAKMGLKRHAETEEAEAGSRTPSLGEGGQGRKRRRRQQTEVETEEEDLGGKGRGEVERQFDDRFPHLDGPPEPARQVFVEDNSAQNAGMDTLLEIVKGDIQLLQAHPAAQPGPYYPEPPVPPTQFFPQLNQHLQPPFSAPSSTPPAHQPLPPDLQQPLLPRPQMMPADLSRPYLPPIQTFVPKHFPRHPPPQIVPLRLDENNPATQPRNKTTHQNPPLPPILPHQPIQPAPLLLRTEPPQRAPPRLLNVIAPRPENRRGSSLPGRPRTAFPDPVYRAPVKLLPKTVNGSTPSGRFPSQMSVRPAKFVVPLVLQRGAEGERAECEMRPLKRLIDKTFVLGGGGGVEVEKRASMGRWDSGGEEEEGGRVLWEAEVVRKGSDMSSSGGTKVTESDSYGIELGGGNERIEKEDNDVVNGIKISGKGEEVEGVFPEEGRGRGHRGRPGRSGIRAKLTVST